MKKNIIYIGIILALISCNNKNQMSQDSVTIPKEEYEELKELENSESSKTIETNEVEIATVAEETKEESYVQQIWQFEKKITINSSGNYIVPEGKIWDIKYSSGVNPTYGFDSTGTVHIECGGYLDITSCINHDCGYVTNMAGERFKVDEKPITMYYLNSYPDLFAMSGHKIKYERGCSKEILNIDQYVFR